MATVAAFLQHGFIGKASQEQPYTARAHSRYIQRQSATQSVHTYLMPEDYRARQRWFFDQENNIRRNGRVIDKFIIAIPRDISADHAVSVLDAFGRSLGNERCPFMFSLQGFDGQNHHAHMVFVDRDFETGKRVFGTTLRNSTQNIKLEWERVANSMFEQLGYDVRVKVAQREELYAENDNSPELPTGLPEPEEHFPETEDAREGEDEMAVVRNDLAGVDPVIAIKHLHDQRATLEYLHTCQERIATAQAQYEFLVREREKLQAEAGQYHTESLPILMEAYKAKERLLEHQNERGELKGKSLSIFGYTLFKTGARKAAEVAQVEARQAEMAADKVNYTRQSYEQKVDQLSAQATQEERKAYTYRAMLEKDYGTDEEIAAAEEAIANGIRETANLVTLEQAVMAYGEGFITYDEYRTFLLEGGYEAELQLLDEGQSESGAQL